jgi:hypothetical protein
MAQSRKVSPTTPSAGSRPIAGQAILSSDDELRAILDGSYFRARHQLENIRLTMRRKVHGSVLNVVSVSTAELIASFFT